MARTILEHWLSSMEVSSHDYQFEETKTDDVQAH